MPEICDYEGSEYATAFWGPSREYEDAVDRRALGRLLPPVGARLVEIGAGFGRLASLYAGYDEVFLVDYSRSLLLQAQEALRDRPKVTFVVTDLYNLPLADDWFDTAVMVRVLHHVQDVSAAFGQVARILAPGGAYVLEYANKRNAKEVLRFLAGRPHRQPFSREPSQVVPLNYNFHPAYIRERLGQVGFQVEAELTASFFRVDTLKRIASPAMLARIDGWLQRPLAGLKPGPSVFVRARLVRPGQTRHKGGVWRCPRCGSLRISETADAVSCNDCGSSWPRRGSFYDFKGQGA